VILFTILSLKTFQPLQKIKLFKWNNHGLYFSPTIYGSIQLASTGKSTRVLQLGFIKKGKKKKTQKINIRALLLFIPFS